MEYDLADILANSDFASFMKENSSMAHRAIIGCYSEFLMFDRLKKLPYLKNVRSPGDPTANSEAGEDKGMRLIPDFYYESLVQGTDEGKTISHEHKTISSAKSNAPLGVLRVSHSLLTDEKIGLTLPYYNVYDIVSVDLRYCDKILYVPMFRFPLHKKYPGRHSRVITPKIAIQIGHELLSDALTDIAENQSLITENEEEFKKDVTPAGSGLGFSMMVPSTGISQQQQQQQQKNDKKTGLDRFFIL